MTSAVIFDCDGVLVDSEVVAHQIEIAALAELGLVYDPASFKARFMGLSDAAWAVALDEDSVRRIGRPVMAEAWPLMKEGYEAAQDRIGEVPGAAAAVAALGALPKAVASSSGAASLERKLRRTGLWTHFAPHVYSADHVANAKPAPDLFLLAARRLGLPADHCLVIEDSVNGVLAARAAGMNVWGFAGGAHMDAGMSARLLEAGADRVLADWAQARALFEHLRR